MEVLKSGEIARRELALYFKVLKVLQPPLSLSCQIRNSRIPDAASAEGIVRDVARSGRGHSDFHRRVRVLPRADTFEKILHVIECPVALRLYMHGYFFRLVVLGIGGQLVINPKSAAMQAHGRFRPAEH